MQADIETLLKLGISEEEYLKIIEILGRTPNFTELSIYSVMWSEHASYKNSIKWIKTLPRTGSCLLKDAGEENAGLVDIGSGYACAFKIESHNHPSAVEPYQGAATGVGGINRDIFTMGARPIAQLNSLRLGNINLPHTKHLLENIVKGIGNYGNAFGVPVVGGELYFDDCYNTNPLVNAMSVGILKKERMISAISKGTGNPIFIVGSSTGKDGIHGATFASADLTENSADDIPSIQVGDPFQEKLLLEAALELSKTDAIVGMQDMGAAGIICSTSEMAAKGKSGMKIDLSLVPLRQKNIEAWEILLSESQERMLLCVKKGKEKIVEDIFNKWELNCVQIGEVIAEDKLLFYYKGELIADVPANSLVLGGGAPVYDREYQEPADFATNQSFDINTVSLNIDLKDIANFLTTNLNIASKKWVYEQYDSMVGTINMSTNFPSDAGIINIKKSKSALAVTTDCNSRYVEANPKIGAMIAVSEAAINIACSGAKPLAITNCLNFGSPYNPEVYWQFVNVIQGMGEACNAFNTPVTGGNVSFYNQTTTENKTEPIFPTPVIGMLGLLEDKSNQTTLAFSKKGDVIFLIGKTYEDISSSEYLYSYHKIKKSPAPYFNLNKAALLVNILQELSEKKLVESMHDVSDGGLYISLLESSMPQNLGFDITTDAEIRSDAFLFGETQGRVIVSVNPEKEHDFIDFMMTKNIDFSMIGHVTKGELRIDDVSFGYIIDEKEKYEKALSIKMKE